jgi:hypothetical protein
VEVSGVEGEADFVNGYVESVRICGRRLGLSWLRERDVERTRCGERQAEMDSFVEDGVPVSLGRLEIVYVTNGHTGWGFDGFGWNKLLRIALELVDAIDEGSAMDGFGGVGERSGGGPLFEEIVDV